MLRRPVARGQNFDDWGRAGLCDGAHGLLDDVREATLLVTWCSVRATVDTTLLQVSIIPLHLFHEALPYLFVDAAMGDELYAITHLGYLGEHRGSTTGNEEIGGITSRRIRCDTGERIRATALHADEQVGQWQFLPLPLVQNLQLLFSHLADGIHHGLVSLIVLKDDDIVLVIQLRPPLAEAVDGKLLTA